MKTYEFSLSVPPQGVMALLLEFIQGHYLAVLAGLIVCSITTLLVHSKHARFDHIPGPFLAKYTNLYSFYNLWKAGQDTDFLHHLHRKYGDVIRTAPRRSASLTPRPWS
jgi:hypothetical protein